MRTLGVSLVLLSLSAGLHGFDEKPWVETLYECYLDSSYNYSRFSSVADAVKPLQSPSNDNLFTFDFGLSPFAYWDAALEVEFAKTPRQNWGMRSFAAEVRVQCLNDIIGDFISLTLGGSARLTSHNSLRDISSPHSSRYDFELQASFGKEFSKGAEWTSRIYGLTALGQGTSGSPWMRADLAYDVKIARVHQLEFFGVTYWGFGKRHEVNIDHFNGWGRYAHQSIDIGLGYTYYFTSWGHLSLDYAHRIYAKVFPRAVNSFTIAYHLPFSFL